MSIDWTSAFAATTAFASAACLIYWVKCRSLRMVMRGLSNHMESIYAHIDWCHQNLDRHLLTYEKMKRSETESLIEARRLSSMVKYLQEDNDALIAELIKRDEGGEEHDWS